MSNGSTSLLTLPACPTFRRGATGELWGFASRYRWRILLTYGLFGVENLLRLAQPLLIGLSIDGLLRGSAGGVIAFALGQAAHMGIRVARQMYDTRAFTAIYAERAGELVQSQRDANIDVSVVAARSALARDFVEFFERQVPTVIHALFSLVGALLVLAFYDGWIVLYCLSLTAPALALNFYFGRKSLRLSGLLHDQLEREVEVVRDPSPAQVEEHYASVARWRIKLSDNEAITMGLMETFVLLLMVGALIHFCTQPAATAGDIFAVFRYVLLFIMALDRVPMLVNQFNRLRDIGRRISSDTPTAGKPRRH